ncbi:MAG: insulinase family protein [Gammaproteobacteria bacterium]|nr:insulinase family protein [Gammaproteobacteria bacterium]
MTQTIKPLIVLCLLAVAGVVQAGLPIEQWKTKKGAQVLFVESRGLPMVQFRLIFDAGSARDVGRQAGIARFTNHMLKQGAGELDADDIATRFEDVGAQFSVDSQRDMATVSLRSLSDARVLGPAVDLLAKILASPTFSEKSLQRERVRALTGLELERQSPSEIAQRRFNERLYADHPYQQYPSGDAKGLKAIGRKELVDYHHQYYVAANAVIAIIGDISQRQARDIAERLVGGLPKGQAAPPIPAVPVRKSASREHISFPSKQSHIFIGQPGIKRGDPDYFPLYVGNYILGGGGLVSRLSEEVREKKGLAYSVYSYFLPMRAPGPFTIGLQTKNSQIDQALVIVNRVVKEFVESGPSAKEMDAAKKNLSGGFPLRIDSNQKIAEYLALIGFYGLPLSYLDDFVANVEAVTVEQVRDAFRRRLHPESMLTVIVGGK